MEELQSKPGQDALHELIIWKVNPFVASVTIILGTVLLLDPALIIYIRRFLVP